MEIATSRLGHRRLRVGEHPREGSRPAPNASIAELRARIALARDTKVHFFGEDATDPLFALDVLARLAPGSAPARHPAQGPVGGAGSAKR